MSSHHTHLTVHRGRRLYPPTPVGMTSKFGRLWPTLQNPLMMHPSLTTGLQLTLVQERSPDDNKEVAPGAVFDTRIGQLTLPKGSRAPQVEDVGTGWNRVSFYIKTDSDR